jgi:pantoate--beta-alanine ligase
MGALHAGHLSLVDAAREQTDFVVVTVFVNPSQFGLNEDYTRYPRPLEDDLICCSNAGVDLVFHPETQTVYPEDHATFVEIPNLSAVLEGHIRPTHFRGVTTVVLKLLNMVQPDVAFFGRKDYQQQLLIRRMVRDLNLPIEIHTCPTIREEDGLALSSRNAYLNDEDRQSALALPQSLRLACDQCKAGQTPAEARQGMLDYLNALPGLKLDYATIVDVETLEELDEPKLDMVALVAARVGPTRLIDNMLIRLE